MPADRHPTVAAIVFCVMLAVITRVCHGHMDYRIHSTQQQPSTVMARYVGAEDRYARPIASHQRRLFDRLALLREHDQRPIVLDSGCGRGMSSCSLQQRFPQYLVLGLDRSAHRLQQAKLPVLAENLWGRLGGPYLARANLIDMWRLLADTNWPIVYHCLWYPNPWPKPKHVQRRFHAHPVFATMLGLSPVCELRTQWSLYADEFCASVRCHSDAYGVYPSELAIIEPCTHFERKYLQASCPLWQVKVIKNGHTAPAGF